LNQPTQERDIPPSEEEGLPPRPLSLASSSMPVLSRLPRDTHAHTLIFTESVLAAVIMAVKSRACKRELQTPRTKEVKGVFADGQHRRYIHLAQTVKELPECYFFRAQIRYASHRRLLLRRDELPLSWSARRASIAFVPQMRRDRNARSLSLSPRRWCRPSGGSRHRRCSFSLPSTYSRIINDPPSSSQPPFLSCMRGRGEEQANRVRVETNPVEDGSRRTHL